MANLTSPAVVLMPNLLVRFVLWASTVRILIFSFEAIFLLASPPATNSKTCLSLLVRIPVEGASDSSRERKNLSVSKAETDGARATSARR